MKSDLCRSERLNRNHNCCPLSLFAASWLWVMGWKMMMGWGGAEVQGAGPTGLLWGGGVGLMCDRLASPGSCWLHPPPPHPPLCPNAPRDLRRGHRCFWRHRWRHRSNAYNTRTHVHAHTHTHTPTQAHVLQGNNETTLKHSEWRFS